jgi:polyferredoxin
VPDELVSIGPPARAAKWKNPYRALPQVRWAVQGAYALFLGLVGYEFWTFHAEAVSGGPISAVRPPAVEAFLPISALVGLKRLVATGRWDDIHPAGLAILLGAIAMSLVARKSFCSWMCPVGTLSRALEWLGARTLWRSRRPPTVPRWFDLPLLSLKYLFLAFFAWVVLVKMPVEAIESFMRSPFNMAADAKMLLFFEDLSATGAVVIGALALLSVLVKHSWCRYLCPYGALLGLASLLSPQRVVRAAATCNDCRACTRACPSQIPVHARGSVWTAECTGCMSCVAACTVEDCLTTTRRGVRGLSPWLVPAAGLGTFLAVWALARATGHWQTALPREVLAQVYRMAPFLSH